MVTIRFSTDNAAMRHTAVDDEEQDDMPVDHDAVSDAVMRVASEISNGATSGVVVDANGNVVGGFDVDED